MVCVLSSVLLSLSSAHAGTAPPAAAATQQRAIASFGRLPLSFTANHGQADPRFAFLAQGSGYSISLSRGRPEVTLEGRGPQGLTRDRLGARATSAQEQDRGPKTQSPLRLSFPGASAASTLTGMEELPGKSNYLIGSDASKWHVGVPNYARVRYAEIYPGVDMVFYGNQRQMEFDFVVAPQADTNAVRLHVDGSVGTNAVQLAVNAAGDLVTTGASERILLHRPVLYQEAGGVRQQVEGQFVLAGSNEVRFRVGAYDRSRKLVIDPTLAYSTYVGGAGCCDGVTAIAVDSTGNAYIIGAGTFVSKLNAQGTGLVYSTYVAVTKPALADEPASEAPSAIAVNAEGEAYVVGNTNALDFPVTAGAFQTKFFGIEDPFVTRLNRDGTGLIYSTFLTGTARFLGLYRLVLDKAGNAYLLGETRSHGYPVTPGALQTNPGPKFPSDPYTFVTDTILTKLNPSGSKLVYSTYFGGFAPQASTDSGDLAVDVLGDVYMTGAVSTPIGFPVTAGAFSKVGSGFVVKLNPTAARLLYATLLKGSQIPAAMAIDPEGNTYITGRTQYRDLPVTAGAYQTTCEVDESDDECAYTFVQKLNPGGTGLVYSTYFGTGPAGFLLQTISGVSTNGRAIAIDAAGDVFLAGDTTSPTFPVTAGAVQSSPKDPNDPYYEASHAFLTEFNAAGSGLLYSTYLGTGDFYGDALAMDQAGGVYVAGDIFSERNLAYFFPTTPNAFKSNFPTGALAAGFVTKFSFGEPLCGLQVKLQLDTASGSKDSFVLAASFATGTAAPLDPQTEALTLTIGSEAITLPAGSLVKFPRGYSFNGAVDGIHLFLVLREKDKASGIGADAAEEQTTCSNATYTLLAIGKRTSLEHVTNPVNVTISIGENTGSTETVASIQR